LWGPVWGKLVVVGGGVGGIEPLMPFAKPTFRKPIPVVVVSRRHLRLRGELAS
jgi:hypothetical protein